MSDKRDVQRELRRQFGSDQKKDLDQLRKFTNKIRKNMKEQGEQKAWANADASIIPEHVPPRNDPSDRKYKTPASYVKQMQREREWHESDFPVGDYGDFWVGQPTPPKTQREVDGRIARRV